MIAHFFKELRIVQRGFAMVETASLLIILFSLIFGGVIMTERFQQFATASKLVEELIHEEPIHPLRFSPENFALTVRHNALQEYLLGLLNDGEEEIANRIAAQGIGESLFLEAAYGVIRIDPESGESLGLLNQPVCLVRSRGSSSVDPACLELDGVFQEFASKTLSESDDRSAFALPSVRAHRSANDARYLPYAVVVGLRLGWNIEDGWSASYGEILGLNNQVSELKATVLRGEIEL